MKKVSIIVPVYNVEKYLDKAIGSLINQTYKNLEIILIDDGSTDKSGHICDFYAESDNRIKVIHQINQGAAIAKNNGLDQMTGDYFTFVDSDDFVELDMIEKMVYKLEKYDCDIVECNFIEEYIDSSITRFFHLDGEQFSNVQYLSLFTQKWTCSLLWNKLYKKELTNEVRFKYERRCIDDEFYTYKIVTNAKKIVTISDPLYHYRKRKSSAVNNKNSYYQKNNDKILYIIERFLFVCEKYPQLKDIYMEHLIIMYLNISQERYLDIDDFHKIKDTLRILLFKCITNKSYIKYAISIIKLLFLSYGHRKIRNDELSLDNLFD